MLTMLATTLKMRMTPNSTKTANTMTRLLKRLRTEHRYLHGNEAGWRGFQN